MQGMNARAMLLPPLMILFALVSTACGPKVLVKATKPPAELLVCSGEPVAPTLPPFEWDTIAAAPSVAAAVEMAKTVTGKRDDLMLPYVLDMRAARGDCAAKVAGVRRWTDKMPD